MKYWYIQCDPKSNFKGETENTADGTENTVPATVWGTDYDQIIV